MRKVIVTIVLLVCNLAWAQQGGFFNLGTSGDVRTFVGTGSNANRVGNAVLVYFHTVAASYGASEQYLIACDASWMSDAIRFNFVTSDTAIPREMETQARASAIDVPLDAVELNDWQQSQAAVVPTLKPYMRTLCKGAASEPKSATIPVAIYGENGVQPGGTISILTGSVVRKGDVLDAWMRISHFKLEPTMNGDKPFVIKGVTQTHKVATGTYELQRTSFDCVNRRIFTYQSVEYNKTGSSTNQWSASRDKAQYVEVVPTSVGERQLDAICKIYGGK